MHFFVVAFIDNESFERILLLNHVHNEFSQSCHPLIPGIYNDDPYVLFHSIKSLRNFQVEDERNKGEEWLRKLHRFVTSGENAGYLQEEANESDTAHASTAEPNKIDVTAAYTTNIRLLARLRGVKGAATDARKVLERMHGVYDVIEKEEGSIASIDIRENAYNLLLGLYRDSKSVEDVRRAIELIERMVDAGTKPAKDRKGVPLPTDQSFEYAILALANISDAEAAIQEADKLIQMMEEQEHLERSIVVYNAYLKLCAKQMFGKAELYEKALETLGRLKEMSKQHTAASPSSETLSLVIKSCSLAERTDHESVLATASNLFDQLVAKEADEKSAEALTDGCYYHMMRCVNTHVIDEVERKDKIEDLFSEACQRGLCSNSILTLFRNAVSEEDYILTVGKGRLADSWLANVTGPKALYTDGSKGGAGKNARRHGKSTSDWAKNQKLKDSQRVASKEAKRAKKFFKKIKN